MMIHRRASSRRRRASRSLANSPQQQPQKQIQDTPSQTLGRRASLASSEPYLETLTTGQFATLPGASGRNKQKMSRGSCVPNIALDSDDESESEIYIRRLLPDPEQLSISRICLSDLNRSSRNSLVPDDYPVSRSSRGSIAPDPGHSPRGSLIPDSSRSSRGSLMPDVCRSPRHSLVPDSSLSPRNSLVPLDAVGYTRSPRGSLVPGFTDSRAQLAPDNGMGRSPRHSLVPDSSRSPKGSVANIEFDRSSRGSICPEVSRSLWNCTLPMEVHSEKKERSSRGSIASECLNQSPRGSIVPEMSNRSPRGSIVPESNRSPRGSVCPEGSNRSPRGSIAPHECLSNRSPRGSIGVVEMDRFSHRGSLGGFNPEDEPMSRSPRGSIGPSLEFDRSPRGSLGALGQERRMARVGYNMQEHRRSSADQGTTISRSISPYRQRREVYGSVQSGVGIGAQVNLGYGTTTTPWADSRRASSSVSQFSGDESRRLCGVNPSTVEKGSSVSGGGGAAAVAAYGTLVFQLKDAHLEANSSCDFVYRSLRVICKTTVVTVVLAFLSTMPILMLILGVQFVKDCPREPHIPIYMVVGGVLGALRMFWTLYTQIRSRRPDVLTVPEARPPPVSPTKLASIALSCFLVGWFLLGNYWILSIRWPDYDPKLFDPNLWCHKTLYIFALTHLCIVYLTMFVGLLTCFSLWFCRLLACPWPERYK